MSEKLNFDQTTKVDLTFKISSYILLKLSLFLFLHISITVTDINE